MQYMTRMLDPNNVCIATLTITAWKGVSNLWMVCRGQAMLDSETPHEFLIELVAKFLPLVSCQDMWQAHAHEDLQKQLV